MPQSAQRGSHLRLIKGGKRPRKRYGKWTFLVMAGLFAGGLGTVVLPAVLGDVSRFAEGLSAPPVTSMVSGRASILDGDTLDIRGTRIRLHGIDAPEKAQLCRHGDRSWRCGREATRQLRLLVRRQPVQCEVHTKDRYGRSVATCSVGDTDIGARMVEQGYAVAYRRYSRAYVDEEQVARTREAGVWSGEFSLPWDWRASQRK